MDTTDDAFPAATGTTVRLLCVCVRRLSVNCTARETLQAGEGSHSACIVQGGGTSGQCLSFM